MRDAGPCAAPAPAAEVRGIHHRYRRGAQQTVVLDGIDLAVDRGEVVGVCGPSGAGKSTLLRILGGLEAPTAGAVEMDGRPVLRRRGPLTARRLPRPGYAMPLFQHPVASLDRRWPLWRTVSEPLTARHAPRTGRDLRRQRAAVALERVGLGHLDPEARPSELSVGQAQRVALARAAVARPALLLADEPTSALDLITAAGMTRLLREVADHGTALVVVSHNERLLGVLADRVLRLRDGRLSPFPYTIATWPTRHDPELYT